MEKMKRFIDIHVPVTSCNLHFHYCYVIQNNLKDTSLQKKNFIKFTESYS